MTSKKLAIAIARCSEISAAACDSTHPCHQVVSVQSNMNSRHVPEPWFGDIEHARVLFLSSNPSIDRTEGPSSEEFPLDSWSDELIAEWTTRSTDQAWERVSVTFNHPKHRDFLRRSIDGTYLGYGKSGLEPQTTWNKTHFRAKELLGEVADPSQSYALTEVVHCKSENEVGVKEALPRCTEKWLNPVMQLANSANVLILAGSKVRDGWAKTYFGLSKDYGKKNPLLTGIERAKRDTFIDRSLGRHRLVIYMGQPAFSASLRNLYGQKALELMSQIALGNRAVPKDTAEWHRLLGS